MGNWSDLPPELFLKIAEKTTTRDVIVFEAVCTRWKDTLEDNICVPSNQLPWLMLPDHEEPLVRFYDLIENKFYRFILPEAHTKRICGSCHGWLVITDTDPFPYLLNPVTRQRIDLPPVTTIPGVEFSVSFDQGEVEYSYQLYGETCDQYYFQYVFLNKVSLSGNPSLDKKCLVIARIDRGRMAFCKIGDEQWTLLDEIEGLSFKEHFYSKEKGILYCLGYVGQLVAYDLKGSPVPKVEIIVKECRALLRHCNYLVELSEELVALARDVFDEIVDIIRENDNYDPPEARYALENIIGYNMTYVYLYETNSFDAYKLGHEGRETWTRLRTLDGWMLFLGINDSLCFLAKDFPRCICDREIYYTDNHQTFKGDIHGGHDLGAMNLNDHQVVQFPTASEAIRGVEITPGCPKLARSIFPRPLWFTPSQY